MSKDRLFIYISLLIFQIMLIISKITNIITVSWWLIMLPTIGSVVILITLFIFYYIWLNSIE